MTLALILRTSSNLAARSSVPHVQRILLRQWKPWRLVQVMSLLLTVPSLVLMFINAGKSHILASIVGVLDTAPLYRVLKKESQNRSLANVLAGLGRSRWNFHNAGNDARYTLEALVALVIQARLNGDEAHAKKDAEMAALLEKGNNETGWEQEKMERVEKGDDPTRQAQEECEAWEKAGAKETTRTLTSSP